MKTIKMIYIPSLASFLDEEGIKFKNETCEAGEDIISFQYTDEIDLFYLAYHFGQFSEKIQEN